MLDQDDIRAPILSRIQGQIFEESVDSGFDSFKFINYFMNGKTAWHLDLPRHKTSWCGKGYIIDEFLHDTKVPLGKTWDKDFMYWIGYIYRFWHYYTGEKSKEIYEIGNPNIMMRLYPRLCGMPAKEAIRVILQE